MARYTCLFIVAVSPSNLHKSLAKMLEACDFNVIYDTGDYMMAREKPGQVSFAKLVTVEILIDKTTMTEQETRMSFVVKNEELPLQTENHCRTMFELVTQSVTSSKEWQIIERVAG